MGEQELRQEIQRAQAAVAAGADPEAVAQRFKERTGFESIQAAERDLQFRTQQAPQAGPMAQDATQPLSRAEQRQAGVVDFLQQAGRDVVSTAAKIPDFLKVAGHEITGRFGDELVGQMARQGQTALLRSQALTGQEMDPEAAAESVEEAQRQGTESARESIAESRERIGPLGRGAALLAPAAIPYGVGARAIGSGTGLLGTALRGGTAAAAEGGLFALGGAEGSLPERVAQVDPLMDIAAPGAAGGALSMVLPRAINAMQRRRSGRGQRMGEVLQESVDAEDLTGATRRLGQRERGSSQIRVRGTQERAISDHLYGPLDEQFEEITDPELLRFLREGPEDVQKMTARVSREVASGEQNPSFAQVQRIRDNLRRANQGAAQKGTLGDVIDEFNVRFQEAVPGLREADAAFSVVKGQQEALERGRRMWNRNSADLETTLEQIAARYDDPSEAAAAQEAFRTGLFGEWLARLMERDESSGAVLRKLMDAGPEFRAIEESMFPTSEGLVAFRRAVNEEKSAEAVRNVLRKFTNRFLPWLIFVGGVGAAARHFGEGSGTSGGR